MGHYTSVEHSPYMLYFAYQLVFDMLKMVCILMKQIGESSIVAVYYYNLYFIN
jgi:hypothetical protein